MHFSLPESFAAYVSQRDVKAAVDHILNSKSLEVPADLDWEHLPDFHAAVLAAYQVRSDYATALHQLWNEVWQPVLDSSDIEIQALSIAETQEWSSTHADTGNAWKDEEFYRSFRKNSFLITPPALERGLAAGSTRLTLRSKLCLLPRLRNGRAHMPIPGMLGKMKNSIDLFGRTASSSFWESVCIRTKPACISGSVTSKAKTVRQKSSRCQRVKRVIGTLKGKEVMSGATRAKDSHRFATAVWNSID